MVRHIKNVILHHSYLNFKKKILIQFSDFKFGINIKNIYLFLAGRK